MKQAGLIKIQNPKNLAQIPVSGKLEGAAWFGTKTSLQQAKESQNSKAYLSFSNMKQKGLYSMLAWMKFLCRYPFIHPGGEGHCLGLMQNLSLLTRLM